MKSINEPGNLTDGEGSELGNCRVRFRHLPSRRQMGLDCIARLRLGNIRYECKEENADDSSLKMVTLAFGLE